MDVNVTAPVNSLGFGVVGLNIVLGLERLGHAPALWPIGEIEAPEEHHATLRRALDRRQQYNPKTASLRVSHQNDLAQHVGKRLHCGLPIFELNRFDPVEQHHLGSQDLLIAPNTSRPRTPGSSISTAWRMLSTRSGSMARGNGRHSANPRSSNSWSTCELFTA